MPKIRFVVGVSLLQDDELSSKVISVFSSYVVKIERQTSFDPDLLLIIEDTKNQELAEISYYEMPNILKAEEQEDWPDNAEEILGFAGVLTVQIFLKIDIHLSGNVMDLLNLVNDRFVIKHWTESMLLPFPNAALLNTII